MRQLFSRHVKQAGRMRLVKIVFAVLAGLAAVGMEAPIQAEPLTVGAPHSLRAAFKEIVPMFERESGASVNIVYTPSKTLLHQIEQGASIDVFLSAGLKRSSTCSTRD